VAWSKKGWLDGTDLTVVVSGVSERACERPGNTIGTRVLEYDRQYFGNIAILQYCNIAILLEY
jgi:hypothetical protein